MVFEVILSPCCDFHSRVLSVFITLKIRTIQSWFWSWSKSTQKHYSVTVELFTHVVSHRVLRLKETFVFLTFYQHLSQNSDLVLMSVKFPIIFNFPIIIQFPIIKFPIIVNTLAAAVLKTGKVFI
ncbi:Hypothetical predicted protein [Xyrichtys novacula]|uniref:Uncharacterized protein n=1 Tax=Xyrichtys novacula TaxID=13765 RepID=A0AAV1HLL2_XYRNO|nr:Hypothetical predicted protein [Xyrichtys novacula]